MKFENKESLKWVLKIAFILFTASGFTCFICEEGMQLTTFGAFAYSSAEDWNGLNQHLVIMESAHAFSSFWIKTVGWMNPIMYPAYLQYLENNKAYIKATKSRVIARK